MKTTICLAVLIIGVTAFPQAETGCGQDERGVSRKPGDNWQEDCNRCRCLTAGIPGCTKKFCGDFFSLFTPQQKECRDSLGNTREEGEQWEDGAEICSCGGGVVVCATLITITDVKRDKTSGGISFPGSKQQTKEDSSTCTDSAEIKRQEGESWEEDCNSCRCISGSLHPACTVALCEVIEQPTKKVSSTCTDSAGIKRQEGESWKEDCNSCICVSGSSACTKALCGVIDEDLQADSDDSCQSWQDCSAECPQDVGCICKNGKCKISSGCGTMGAFFRTACSSCSDDGCEDEGACKWRNGQCLPA